MISRDRSSEYADAARRGAPQALQVADRFHLIKNLGDDLETALKRYRDCFLFTDAQETLPVLDPLQEERASRLRTSVLFQRSEQKRSVWREREERRQRYEQIVALREQGLTLKEIASRLPISRSTVERFLAASSFPEKKRRGKEKTKLDTYRVYLFERGPGRVPQCRTLASRDRWTRLSGFLCISLCLHPMLTQRGQLA